MAKSTWRPLALAFVAGAVVLSTVIFGLRDWIPSASQQQWQDSLARTPLPDILHSPRPCETRSHNPRRNRVRDNNSPSATAGVLVSSMIPSPSKAVGKNLSPPKIKLHNSSLTTPIDRLAVPWITYSPNGNAGLDPVMRYALYQTVIHIAVAERRPPIARYGCPPRQFL